MAIFVISGIRLDDGCFGSNFFLEQIVIGREIVEELWEGYSQIYFFH